MSVDIEITLTCDGDDCNEWTDLDFGDLDRFGQVDDIFLPTGWEEIDGEHLCKKCSAKGPQALPGVCGVERSAAPLSGPLATDHYCRLEEGHHGEHECHRHCMTWGCAA